MTKEYTEIADPPYQMVIETVSVCNLRCPACRVGAGQTTRAKSKNPFMSLEMIDKIARESKDFVKHTYLHLWGEPTLHPEIGQIIRKIKTYSSIDLATHGMFVTPELAEDIILCDGISVSIDGIGQEVYEKYRVRGDYEKAMNGLRLLADLAKKYNKKIGWTFIVFAHNEHQQEEAQRMADELGVIIGFKPPYLIDEKTQKEMLPKGKGLQRYEINSEGVPVLKADRYKCREFWETMYVVPNGDVVTCCYDFDNWIVCGNLNQNTVMEVWNGPVYRELRRNHLARNLNKVCQNLCKLPY